MGQSAFSSYEEMLAYCDKVNCCAFFQVRRRLACLPKPLARTVLWQARIRFAQTSSVGYTHQVNGQQRLIDIAKFNAMTNEEQLAAREHDEAGGKHWYDVELYLGPMMKGCDMQIFGGID